MPLGQKETFMTDSTNTNPYSIGGTSFGALSAEEMSNQLPLYSDLTQAEDTLQNVGARMANALSHQYSAFTDVEKCNKYASDLNSASLVGGALSVQPLFGRLIVANTDNAETNGTFRADGKNSHMYSSSNSTTLGSTSIDTVSGYDMNMLGNSIPSSFFTPLKTWFEKLFPIFTDKRLVYIAVVEGILILLNEYLKERDQKTTSEQIEQKPMTQIIEDNQLIEDWILGQSEL